MVLSARLPSLVSIQAFEAAARHGSFAAAARELGTTAASVSYHVKQLERQVGATLFRRLAHRVELTEPGRVISTEASAAFASLRGSFTRAIELDQSHLSVSALPTFADAWLVPKLGSFRAQCPTISIEIETSIEAQDLMAGTIDVAVRNGHGNWPGLYATRLLPAIFTPLCAPDISDVEEILAHPGGRNLPLLGRRSWWAMWFRALGRPLPDKACFGPNLATEHLDAAAAIAGQGIAIGSPILFGDEIKAGRLVAPHPLVVGDGRAFWFVSPIGRQSCAKILTFRDWIQDAARSATAGAAPYLSDAVYLEPTGPLEQPRRPIAVTGKR